jgi:Ca2+:H+ antiporter
MNEASRKHSNGRLSTVNSRVSEHSPLLGAQETNNTTAPNDGHPWSYQDSRPWVSYPAGFARLTWLILISNPVNVLLVFVPLGIVSGALGWNPIAVFTLNFLAIVPLAALLSFATEELSAELGDTIGGLMNASFGNAVELIVAIMALIRNEIVIVQTGMLGSILSNILLVCQCSQAIKLT